jgi:tRNA (guanine37-N1)-methyltransferase
MFQGPFEYSIIKNAKDKKKVKIYFVNIRNFGIGKHKNVDDRLYGGGHGMIIRVDVLERAIAKTKDKKLSPKDQKVILLSPRGKAFNQKKAKQFSNLKHLILICGRYEGVDERIKKYIDEEISIGDFVVTGGEIPAMLITDAVTRLIDGVLKKDVTTMESFYSSSDMQSPVLEYPQYTKPNSYKNENVPPVLLSGNHAKIEKWRKKQSIQITSKLRPDLLKSR